MIFFLVLSDFGHKIDFSDIKTYLKYDIGLLKHRRKRQNNFDHNQFILSA